MMVTFISTKQNGNIFMVIKNQFNTELVRGGSAFSISGSNQAKHMGFKQWFSILL